MKKLHTSLSEDLHQFSFQYYNIMKKFITNTLICAFALTAKAQIIHFSYDPSGNRVNRSLLDSNSNNARTRGVAEVFFDDTTCISILDGHCRYTYFFDGSMLHIKCKNEAKSNRVVSIYSIAGIRLSSKSSIENEFVFDLSGVESTMFVITIQAPGMENLIVKILK